MFGSSDPAQTEMDSSAAPSSTSTVHPTKFAKLLRVVMPIVQGGAMGGFGGNWRVPGSGAAAAQNMFGQQRAQRLQQQEMGLRTQMLQRQLYDDQFRNAQEAARTEELKSQGRRYDQLATAQAKDKPVIEDTDAGMMVVDPEKAEARPITNMAPEQTGSLPLPNEPTMPALHKAQRPTTAERPTVLSQGQEAVDPKTGRVIATGQPKTFAPKSPRPSSVKTPKPDEAKVESRAQSALQYAGGDPEKAVTMTEQNKYISDAEKFAVIQRIRKLKPPSKSKFTRTPEEMRKMATAPPS